MLADRWRCRPSVADRESAIWVLRQQKVDEVRRVYRALAAREIPDDDE